MLPRDRRLRRTAEFQRVYRRGRSWAHPLAVLHVLARPEGQRVGVSVSRKVGSSVARNRVRRRFREAVRARLPLWKEGLDAVIVARPRAAEAGFREISAAVEELGRRARLEEPAGGPPRREERAGPAGSP